MRINEYSDDNFDKKLCESRYEHWDATQHQKLQTTLKEQKLRMGKIIFGVCLSFPFNVFD